MYEERKNKFSFKSFFLTLLLVVLFVLLLLWLFPSKWDLKKIEKVKTNKVITSNAKDLTVVYDDIFKSNIDAMKSSALNYFTKSKLSDIKDKSVKLSLKEMYEKHIILELKDKDGNLCDEDSSYIEVTKKDKEFELKTNLKCGNDENYIITYINDSNECLNSCTSNTNNTTNQKNNTTLENTGKVLTATEPEKKIHSCEIINGVYYNKSGNNVSKIDYEKSCGQVTNLQCQSINGKYYDPNGNMVGLEDYEKLCNIKTDDAKKEAKESKKYYCKNVNGKYYDSNGNVVSKGEYKKSCQ